MTTPLFAVTGLGDGVASLRIATDEEPYLGAEWVTACDTAVAAVASDTSVRVLVLEGGTQYFSAGASREVLVAVGGQDDFPRYAARAAQMLLRAPIPIVAAAAGHAVGGGLLLALWCDVLVLAEESLYGANFMQLGFTPGMGATHAMQEGFGGPLGRTLLMSGQLLTGREIRQAACPLSHAVVPRAQVMPHALSIAREIAEAPRDTLFLLKALLSAPRRDALDRALEGEGAAHTRLFADPAIRAEIIRRYPAPSAPGARNA